MEKIKLKDGTEIEFDSGGCGGLFDITEGPKTVRNLLNTYNIDPEEIAIASAKIMQGQVLSGGTPISYIRKLKGDMHEETFVHLFDFTDDDPEELIRTNTADILDVLESLPRLNSLLLVFASENGNPDDYISAKK